MSNDPVATTRPTPPASTSRSPFLGWHMFIFLFVEIRENGATPRFAQREITTAEDNDKKLKDNEKRMKEM